MNLLCGWDGISLPLVAFGGRKAKYNCKALLLFGMNKYRCGNLVIRSSGL
jgi:hypothetical protein